MKNILIIVNTYKDQYNLFVEAGKKINANVVITTYDDIFIENEKNIKVKNTKLSFFNIVYFRVIIRKIDKTQKIINYCNKNNIFVEDQSLQTNLIYSKIYDQNLFENNNVPTIKSEAINLINLNKKIELFSFPVVVKIADASQGIGVKLCHDIEEIKKMFSEFNKDSLLLQEYIKNDGDLRVLVIGNKVIGAIKRSSKNKNEFRNNVSLGGDSKKFETSKEIIETAKLAAKTLKYSFAGVDLIFDEKEKNWKILEVNRAPQFEGFMKTLKINVAELFIQFLIKKYS